MSIGFYNLKAEVWNNVPPRIRSRVSNLGDEKNPDFITLVLTGGVSAEMVAKMAPEVRSLLSLNYTY